MQRTVQKEHRCVTWPQFITAELAILAVTAGMMGGVFQLTMVSIEAAVERHRVNRHAHDDETITVREFERLITRLDRIENKVDALGNP